MELQLDPGEKIRVTFKDSDGSVTVAFGFKTIMVNAELPNSQGHMEEIMWERSIVETSWTKRTKS